MDRIFLRLFVNLLGGVAGFVLGLVLTQGVMAQLLSHAFILLLTTTTLIGILVSFAVLEYQNSQVMRRNNKIRDETIALITHEMRTGLTSTGWAISHIQEAYKEALTPDDKKMLEDVNSSIRTTVMHSIDLLDVSLIDISKLSISLQWVTLKQVEVLFSEMLQRFMLGAEKNQIKLISHIELNPILQAQMDMIRIRVILENLLENAFQYTKGDIREVKLDVTNDPNNINIKVSDTGIGIPLLEQPKIFTQFYRAENARKMLSSGTGIGLYLCDQYVRAHGGKIWFQSKEGQGTTFFISIPIKTKADINEFLVKI